MFLSFSREDIALRAYLIWQAGGRQPGCDLDNWLQAEQELSLQQVFQGACLGCRQDAQDAMNFSNHEGVALTNRG